MDKPGGLLTTRFASQTCESTGLHITTRDVRDGIETIINASAFS